MPIDSILLNGIQNDRKAIDNVNNNYSKANIPGAHRTDIVSVPVYSGGNLISIKAEERRAEDEQLSRLIRSNITSYNHADNTVKALKDLQSVLSDPNDPTKSTLVLAINDFFSKAIPLANNHDISLVQNFINQGVDLANTLSVGKNKIDQLRFNADQDLSSSLQDANNIIRQIYDLNQSLIKSSSPALDLLDDRDRLLNDLAEQFKIRVTFGNNGIALVATEAGGTSIVDRNRYAQFNYLGVSSEEQLINGAKINPVVLNYRNQKGVNYSTNISVIDDTKSNNTYVLQGGKIASCVELRDTILPNSLAAINNFSKLVVDNVNALHNNCSPYPPKTNYTSSDKFRLSDSNLWIGTTTIAVIDGKGNAVNGSSGPFKPITIDLANIGSRSDNGLTTVQNIIDEINSFFEQGPSAQRISLGEFPSTDSTGINNKYLLNDIKLAGKSNIEQGELTFDLDLDGSNFFGSKIEILDVQTGDVGGVLTSIPADQLPAQFTLEKNAHLRTNQPITVSGLTIGTIKDVNIRVRVIGDNGVIQEGTVNFKIDPSKTDMLNKRITGSVPIPTVAGNDFVGNIGPTHASIARAKLIDDNGVEISKDDIYTEGRLVIESINNQYGLIISNDSSTELGNNLQGIVASSYGFTQYFGLNNLFEYDGTPQNNIFVRSDIANDVSKLSIAIPSNDNGVRSTVEVGSIQASGTLNFFSGVPIGGDFSNGDTITINGVTLTFSNIDGPFNILLGGNIAISLGNLVDKISNIDSLGSVISATLGANDDVTLTAINPGISGNFFNVSANLSATGTTIVDFNNPTSATATANLAPSNLSGGGNRDETIITYGQSIGRSSTDFFEALANLNNQVLTINAAGTIPATSGTLHNYSSTVSSFLANQTSKAISQKTTQETVLKKFTIELRDKTGIDSDEEYLKSIELDQSLYFKYRALNFEYRIIEMFMAAFNNI